MSRIGRKPVIIPKGVEVNLNGSTISVKGPKGQLVKEMPKEVTMTHEENQIICSIPEKSCKPVRSKFGLVRSLVHNMVVGVSSGYEIGLQIVGVGYRAISQAPNRIQLNVGFSHPVVFEAVEGVTLKIEGNKVLVSGIDKEAVGHTAALIRKVRPPRHYKEGAGIRYVGENVRIKVGKKLAA